MGSSKYMGEKTVVESIYYLPGRGGEIKAGLGLSLSERGYLLQGREVTGDLAGYGFQDQTNIIKQDLKAHYWYPEAEVVAVSYGAYLLLHALAEMRTFPGRLLLLSPILGGVAHEKSFSSFTPPRADRLMKRIYAGKFPIPVSLEIHVGENDWQSNPVRVAQLGERLNADCFYAVDTAHSLGIHYVSSVLDQWLRLKRYELAG